MAPKGEATCPVTCLVPGLLGPRFQGHPAFGCRPPISLPHPYVPCAAESRPRPSGACLPSGTSCACPQHCSSPHRSMANLSVLFGQVSGRVGGGSQIWAGVPSATNVTCVLQGGVGQRGYRPCPLCGGAGHAAITPLHPLGPHPALNADKSPPRWCGASAQVPGSSST